MLSQGPVVWVQNKECYFLSTYAFSGVFCLVGCLFVFCFCFFVFHQLLMKIKFRQQYIHQSENRIAVRNCYRNCMSDRGYLCFPTPNPGSGSQCGPQFLFDRLGPQFISAYSIFLKLLWGRGCAIVPVSTYINSASNYMYLLFKFNLGNE